MFFVHSFCSLSVVFSKSPTWHSITLGCLTPTLHLFDMLWKGISNSFILGFWQHHLPTHQLPYSVCSQKDREGSTCLGCWPGLLVCFADASARAALFYFNLFSHQLQNSVTTHVPRFTSRLGFSGSKMGLCKSWRSSSIQKEEHSFLIWTIRYCWIDAGGDANVEHLRLMYRGHQIVSKGLKFSSFISFIGL